MKSSVIHTSFYTLLFPSDVHILLDNGIDISFDDIKIFLDNCKNNVYNNVQIGPLLIDLSRWRLSFHGYVLSDNKYIVSSASTNMTHVDLYDSGCTMNDIITTIYYFYHLHINLD
jgi:hypothetical protein